MFYTITLLALLGKILFLGNEWYLEWARVAGHAQMCNIRVHYVSIALYENAHFTGFICPVMDLGQANWRYERVDTQVLAVNLVAFESEAHMQCVGVEIACNLLDEGVSSVSDVMQRVAQLAAEAGVQLPSQQLDSEPGNGPYVLGRIRADLVAFASSQLRHMP